jgi:hypothetical protein
MIKNLIFPHLDGYIYQLSLLNSQFPDVKDRIEKLLSLKKVLGHQFNAVENDIYFFNIGLLQNLLQSFGENLNFYYSITANLKTAPFAPANTLPQEGGSHHQLNELLERDFGSFPLTFEDMETIEQYRFPIDITSNGTRKQQIFGEATAGKTLK